MQLKTIVSVAVLAVSGGALAQMTTQPDKPMPGNNMSMPMNSTMPDSSMPNSSMPMNTQDETMMNDSSMPNSTTPPR